MLKLTYEQSNAVLTLYLQLWTAKNKFNPTYEHQQTKVQTIFLKKNKNQMLRTSKQVQPTYELSK